MAVPPEKELAHPPVVTSAESLAIILPVYNEQTHIRVCIERLLNAVQQFGFGVQIILVDDGSTDGTRDVLREIASTEGKMELHEHEANRGKGAAIRTGLEVVTAAWVTIHDADLEYDPADLKLLYKRAQKGDADAVYGSRCLRDSRNARRRNVFALAVWGLNLTVRVLYGARITDEATCYKMFRTTDLRQMGLQCERFEFCAEVTAKAAKLGLAIAEVPISYQPRNRQQGKKIQFRDGVEAFSTLWRYRKWNSVSYEWHHTR